MNYRSILTLTGILSLIAAVSADTANFSRQVPFTDTLIANQTFINSTSWSTPLVFFLLTVAIGAVLLVASIVLPAKIPYDMLGYLAPIPLAFATLMAGLGIDIRTASGVSGALVGIAVKTTMTEAHTVYQPWLLVIMLLIFTLISIVNIVRVMNEKAERALSGDDS